MKKQKGPGGAIGKGGISPAPMEGDLTVRAAAEQLLMVPIDELVPYANNARVHTKAQIAQIRASLREFGFVAPVLIDFDNNIIAGHGRVEAARAEGMAEVPCVLVSNLTEAQRKAYILADNRLSETGSWDPRLLKLEIEGLEALSFDTGLTGFDVAAVESLQFGEPGPGKSVGVSSYTRAAPGTAGGGEKPEAPDAGTGFGTAGGAQEPEDTEEYRQFVEKFKPKLTTDDCYTPDNVYQCVKDWAVCRYGLEGREVLRPFYPGGDYQNAAYPEGAVVIDNPPFSILSEICRFYNERDIPYFLFAPTLTLFSVASGECNYLLIDATVTYANGAGVNTSFVTNLGEWKFESAPDLYQLVKAADNENRHKQAAELPGYVYPPEVLTAGACRLAKHGQCLHIAAEDMAFVRALDAQKEKQKTIFGGGFFLSESAAKEYAAANRAADEYAATKWPAVKWELSERERQLVRELGRREG